MLADATLAGKIEVEAYPVDRSSVAEARGASTSSYGILFFSLSKHVCRSVIEMTAPVVNSYKTTEMLDKPGATGEMSMKFF
jgi:hypothetical protein